MLIVPSRGKISVHISPILEFASYQSVGRDESKPFIIIPTSHDLKPISSPCSGRRYGLISQDTIVRTFRREWDTVEYGHRITIIMFIESFGREFQVWGRTVFPSLIRLGRFGYSLNDLSGLHNYLHYPWIPMSYKEEARSSVRYSRLYKADRTKR